MWHLVSFFASFYNRNLLPSRRATLEDLLLLTDVPDPVFWKTDKSLQPGLPTITTKTSQLQVLLVKYVNFKDKIGIETLCCRRKAVLDCAIWVLLGIYLQSR